MASCADTPCPHLSIPVEMDESMTSSSLNLAWPACQKCSSHVDVSARNNDIRVNDNGELECSGGCPRGCGLPSKVNGFVLPVATPTFGGVSVLEVDALHLGRHPYPERLPLEDEQCESSGFSQYNYCNEKRQFHLQGDIEESLEPPRSLRSDLEGPRRLFPHRLHGLAHFPVEPRCPQHHHPHLNYHTPEHQRYMHARPSLHPIPGAAMVRPHHQVTAPMRDMMSEAFVLPSRPVVAPEMKRTVSLPEECRTVFITYSIDTAKDIFKFVAFLSNQGFRPAIDIFENAVRQMDVNKWMDSYLKNKSVLIIVVISPRYKQDIEGDGSDQHGLHTKYIHAQIQNEFIQQRCLNFRIVPVLFPNANQSHVPMWLQSTRVFRWPQDAEDLLLRLLREERYIPPPRGHEITLSIKSL